MEGPAVNNSTSQLPLFPTEEWRDIAGFEGVYQVSDLGRVRSLPHTIAHSVYPGRTRVSPGRVLRQHCGDRGYCAVAFNVNGKNKRYEVHRLVGEAFIGSLPAGHHTHHINGDPSDNRLINLTYYSSSYHHHIHNRGVNAHRNVLTEQQVIEIRRRLANGESQVALGKEYGVARTNIGAIERRESWAWLHAEFDTK
jgi:hypothetical protein